LIDVNSRIGGTCLPNDYRLRTLIYPVPTHTQVLEEIAMSILAAVEELVFTQDELDYRAARLPSDRLKAFRLVYNSYLRAGLGEQNHYEMRVTPYQLLPTSQIFVARLQSEVVSTVTLVGDSEHGLPMESMFAEEVDQLRKRGRRIAEVSCLADRRKDPGRFLTSFSSLTRCMAQYARSQGITNLLVSVHPRHARFYCRYLGFRAESARVVECPHVRNRPAVALNLDFDVVDMERPESYGDYFDDQIPAAELVPYQLGDSERNFLEDVARASCEAFHTAGQADTQAA
jgi:hypothetical protein